LDEGGVHSELGFESFAGLMARLKERCGAQALPAAGPPNMRMPVSFKVRGALVSKPMGRPGAPAAASAASAAAATSAATPSLGSSAAPRLTSAAGAGADGSGGAAVVVLDEDASVEQLESRKVRAAWAATTAKSAGYPPPPEDAYMTRSAPLVLLRSYAAQDRWQRHHKGQVIFEDDGVQYPAFTLLPLREAEESNSPLLSLVSVWLLVALRDRYEAHATAQLCERLSAVRISSRHTSSLLEFLLGRSQTCPLLVSGSSLASVPPPVPTRLPRPAVGAVSRPPISPVYLRNMPAAPMGKAAASTPSPGKGVSAREKRKQADAADDKALTAEMVGVLQARAEAEAALCRTESEVAALSGLMRELEAQLQTADRELAKSRQEGERFHKEYLADLGAFEASRGGPAAKRRRVGMPAPPQPRVQVEDPLARLLAPLGVLGVPVAE